MKPNITEVSAPSAQGKMSAWKTSAVPAAVRITAKSANESRTAVGIGR